MRFILLLLLLYSIPTAVSAAEGEPSPLLKMMTVRFEQRKLSQVLDELSTKGGFVFAYDGKAFDADSLVNLKAEAQPVWRILDQLFRGKADYKVHDNYIILRLTFLQLAIYPENITASEQSYAISGYVRDETTGRMVKQASVYDKKLLQAVMTDDKGHFSIRFKGKHDYVLLTASKEMYRDTMMIFLKDIRVAPSGYVPKPEEKVTAAGYVLNKLGIARFLISSRQKIQNMNIPDFFANTPVQVSFTPGLSSHGMMSGQVVNKCSFNLLGGYTAGVDGMEMGGLFNINRGNVKYLQVAGLFNYTSGAVRGIQLSGMANHVGQQTNGLQAAGLINRVNDSFTGLQMAGLLNMTRKDFKGFQVAGLGNSVSGTLAGFQLAGLFNYARHNKGLQIALVNQADSSSGVSIGLLNLIKNGYHQFGVYSNEITPIGISYKSGTPAFYTVFMAGTRLSWNNDKLFTAGIGMGHEFIFNPRFSLATELSSSYIFDGYGKNNDSSQRFQTNFQFRASKKITVFAGPAYSLYKEKDSPAKAGFHGQVAPDYAHQFNHGIKGWLGWNLGITLF